MYASLASFEVEYTRKILQCTVNYTEFLQQIILINIVGKIKIKNAIIHAGRDKIVVM